MLDAPTTLVAAAGLVSVAVALVVVAYRRATQVGRKQQQQLDPGAVEDRAGATVPVSSVAPVHVQRATWEDANGGGGGGGGQYAKTTPPASPASPAEHEAGTPNGSRPSSPGMALSFLDAWGDDEIGDGIDWNCVKAAAQQARQQRGSDAAGTGSTTGGGGGGDISLSGSPAGTPRGSPAGTPRTAKKSKGQKRRKNTNVMLSNRFGALA